MAIKNYRWHLASVVINLILAWQFVNAAIIVYQPKDRLFVLEKMDEKREKKVRINLKRTGATTSRRPKKGKK